MADAHQSSQPGASRLSGLSRSRLMKEHLILPPEHGAWIWLAGPFVVGAVAGKSWSLDILLCGATVLAAFFARQPVTLLVKMMSGRRSRRELAPVLFWLAVDGSLAAILAVTLALRGYTQILLLALPAVPVFGWYLWLVSRRAERRQTGVQIVAAGVLSLAAPAGYWVAGGNAPGLPWIMWGVMWFQAAASIVFVQLRLEQREWNQAGSLPLRLSRGKRALLYNGFNALAGLLGWVILGLWPIWLAVGFGLMLVDTIEGVLRPAVGARPNAVGIRQGISSGIFILLAALSFSLI